MAGLGSGLPSFFPLAALARGRRGLEKREEKGPFYTPRSRTLLLLPPSLSTRRTTATVLAGSAFRLRLRKILFLSRNPFAGGAPPLSLSLCRRLRNRRERSPLRWFGARRAVEARDVPVRALFCRHCIGCRRGRHRRYRNAGDVTREKQGTRRGEPLPSFLRSFVPPSLPFHRSMECHVLSSLWLQLSWFGLHAP